MRRIAILTLVAALVAAACGEAFEPPPGSDSAAGSPAASEGVGPGSTPEASPSPTPEPSPVEMAVADLPTEGDDLIPVRVLGWIETGGSVLCGAATCIIDLHDTADPREDVSLEVVTDASGVPNTMVWLGSGYEEADLEVTTDDGDTLWAGDYAWITGTWDAGHETLSADVIERGKAPYKKPLASTIAQLRTRKEATLVRVVGRLDTPFLLSCYGGTCNLYLQDVKSASRSARIEVRLGPHSGARPNTMRPLEDQFSPSDLRVFDARKRTCRAGDRVAIVGWVYRTEDGDPYIDPIQSITWIGS